LIFRTFDQQQHQPMVQKKKETYGFLLVAAGLLIGFFLGAGIIYLFTNRADEHLLTDAALERIARIFQPAEQGPATAGTVIPDRAVPSGKDSPAGATNLPTIADKSIPTGEADDSDTPESLSAEPIEGELIRQAGDGDPEILSGTDTMENSLSPAEQHTRSVVDENIRVRRDRLLGTQAFNLAMTGLSAAPSESTRRLDSLLGNRQEAVYRQINVEFWESPLNFTGYKMGKNRVIIYGLDQIESVSIQTLDDNIFLKYYEFYFPLLLTSEFLPLVPVSDTLLIYKLELQWP
jgi:hypothetical protein